MQVPDEVTQHLLKLSGTDCQDVRLCACFPWFKLAAVQTSPTASLHHKFQPKQRRSVVARQGAPGVPGGAEVCSGGRA